MSATPRAPLIPVRKLPTCPECGNRLWRFEAPHMQNGCLVCSVCEHMLTLEDLSAAEYKRITPEEFYKNVFEREP